MFIYAKWSIQDRLRPWREIKMSKIFYFISSCGQRILVQKHRCLVLCRRRHRHLLVVPPRRVPLLAALPRRHQRKTSLLPANLMSRVREALPGRPTLRVRVIKATLRKTRTTRKVWIIPRWTPGFFPTLPHRVYLQCLSRNRMLFWNRHGFCPVPLLPLLSQKVCRTEICETDPEVIYQKKAKQ